MNCCSDPKIEQVVDVGSVCTNCDSMVFAGYIIEERDYPKTFKQRIGKFKELVQGSQLGWRLKHALVDSFYLIERHFNETVTKGNFLNTSQVIVEILIMLGKGKHIHMFKQLRTPKRVKYIKKFVNDAFKDQWVNAVPQQLKLTKIICDDVYEPKVSHRPIYIDILV